ncbi:MAG: hypothetical protein ACKOF3_14045, partial [Spartobacteria bacterium]
VLNIPSITPFALISFLYGMAVKKNAPSIPSGQLPKGLGAGCTSSTHPGTPAPKLRKKILPLKRNSKSIAKSGEMALCDPIWGMEIGLTNNPEAHSFLLLISGPLP